MELTKILKNVINRRTNGVDNLAIDGQKQYSLHDGEKIYDLIRKEIDEARSSIYVAASWFTDYDLFNTLLQKYGGHTTTDIRIILDGKKDNFYLPFKKLVDNGAKVKLMKKAMPYGQMHDKFCIIDNQKLISGSYNWSKNARTNNDENVIYTEDPKLISEFLDKFNLLLEGCVDFDPDNLNKIEEDPEEPVPAVIVENDIFNYEKLITQLVYTQVHSYDENKLLEQGKERSKKCAGDAANLLHELDNVYSGLLRDIKISNDKKEIIKLTLQEQLERSKSETDLKARNEIDLLEKEATIQRAIIEDEIVSVKNGIASIETEINSIKADQYKTLQTKLKESDDKISEVSNSTYRPSIPLYTFIPNIVLLLLVMLYCGIFYSSAAYILIYSQDDAIEAKLKGEIAKSPDIFYGEAMSKALDRGAINLIFILLVPVFIMGLIFVINKFENPWRRYAVLIAVIIFIDGFTAYKVAESIHQIKYLKGLTDESWNFSMALKSSDFYLVLVFGLSALITFELLLGRWLQVMDNRNSDIKYHKSQNELNNQKQIKAKLESEFADLNNLINLKSRDINSKIEEITKLKKSISRGESDFEHKKYRVQNTYEHHKFTFENITRINLVRVDNETFTFSIVYMLDRVSTYMRGWKDFLHEHFAVDIAIQKSRQADEQVLIWKSANLKNLKEYTL